MTLNHQWPIHYQVYRPHYCQFINQSVALCSSTSLSIEEGCWQWRDSAIQAQHTKHTLKGRKRCGVSSGFQKEDDIFQSLAARPFHVAFLHFCSYGRVSAFISSVYSWNMTAFCAYFHSSFPLFQRVEFYLVSNDIQWLTQIQTTVRKEAFWFLMRESLVMKGIKSWVEKLSPLFLVKI